MVVFSFPVPQDVVDPDENIKYQLVISSAVGCVVFTIAVGLRFVSRRLVKAPLSWDDWLVLAALVSIFLCVQEGSDHLEAFCLAHCNYRLLCCPS